VCDTGSPRALVRISSSWPSGPAAAITISRPSRAIAIRSTTASLRTITGSWAPSRLGHSRSPPRRSRLTATPPSSVAASVVIGSSCTAAITPGGGASGRLTARAAATGMTSSATLAPDDAATSGVATTAGSVTTVAGSVTATGVGPATEANAAAGAIASPGSAASQRAVGPAIRAACDDRSAAALRPACEGSSAVAGSSRDPGVHAANRSQRPSRRMPRQRAGVRAYSKAARWGRSPLAKLAATRLLTIRLLRRR